MVLKFLFNHRGARAGSQRGPSELYRNLSYSVFYQPQEPKLRDFRAIPGSILFVPRPLPLRFRNQTAGLVIFLVPGVFSSTTEILPEPEFAHPALLCVPEPIIHYGPQFPTSLTGG